MLCGVFAALHCICVYCGAGQFCSSFFFQIDCSNIINQARQIVKDNGFEDKITLIQGKV